MNRLIVVVALAAIAGCQKPGTESDTVPATPAPGGSTQSPSPSMPSTTVRLVLDRGSYRARDMVKLTISNDGQQNLGYNACTRTIEREDAGGWTAVPEPDRVCTMELRLLARGETVSEQTDLPALSAGRYRIAMRFSDESPTPSGPVRAASAPFTVN